MHDGIPRQLLWMGDKDFSFHKNFLGSWETTGVKNTVTTTWYICQLYAVQVQHLNISRPNKISRSSTGKQWHTRAQQKLKNFSLFTANEYLHSSIIVCSTLWEVAMRFNTNVRRRIMAPTSVLLLNNFLFSAPFIPGTALTPSSSHFKLVWEIIYPLTLYWEDQRVTVKICMYSETRLRKFPA